jgi:hypothetical protein
MTQQGILVTHCGARSISRAEVQTIDVPPATATWKPIKHADLVDCIEQGLRARGVTVCAEQFAVQREGKVFFGVLDLSQREHDFRAALGMRASNDKQFAIHIAVGVRVFVCDNLAFRGDLIALKRKHTAGLDLHAEVTLALERFAAHFHLFSAEVEELKRIHLTDATAKALMHDAFVQQVMPLRFLPVVAREYFTPSHQDFAPRTAWSLSNAFTHAAKALPVGPRFRALHRLGRIFGALLSATRRSDATTAFAPDAISAQSVMLPIPLSAPSAEWRAA